MSSVDMLGGNLAQLEALATKYLAHGATVDHLCADISGTLDQTLWTGRYSQEFRSRWAAEFAPALRRLHEALAAEASCLRTNRDAIAQATGMA
jgi:uncharacterized protein YukE